MIKATNNSSHWHSTRKQERDGQIWSQRWKLKKEEGQKKKTKRKIIIIIKMRRGNSGKKRDPTRVSMMDKGEQIPHKHRPQKIQKLKHQRKRERIRSSRNW